MSVERLTAELEAAALRAVRSEYAQLNYLHFRECLLPPVLSFTEHTTTLGRYLPEQYAIELSYELLTKHGWGTLIEVLKHEMAHQFVTEVLGVVDESQHGPVFRQVCAERGIDPRSSGVPDNDPASGSESRVLERVAKLLALAQSSNRHEAEAAMSAAQKLMLKYNLELASSDRNAKYVFKHLGEPTGRVNEAEHRLGGIIGQFFFVRAIWVRVWRPLEGKAGSVLEICGTKENVEMAAYVHSFLRHTSERLWREHKINAGIKKNAGRRHFVAGVMAGFYEKLRSDRAHTEQQGLVWVGDVDLEHYYSNRHPRVCSVSRGSGNKGGDFISGREAGKQIVLHRGVSEGPSGGPALLRGKGAS